MTNLTAFDVGVDCLLHLGPPVLSEDQFLCLGNARMSGEDMIMALGDDLASKRGLAWDIDLSVVMQESALSGDSSFVGKGSLDPFVPKLFLTCSIFDLAMYFRCRGHDEGSEMHGLEDDDVVIILLPLIVVIVVR